MTSDENIFVGKMRWIVCLLPFLFSSRLYWGHAYSGSGVMNAFSTFGRRSEGKINKSMSDRISVRVQQHVDGRTENVLFKEVSKLLRRYRRTFNGSSKRTARLHTMRAKGNNDKKESKKQREQKRQIASTGAGSMQAKNTHKLKQDEMLRGMGRRWDVVIYSSALPIPSAHTSLFFSFESLFVRCTFLWTLHKVANVRLTATAASVAFLFVSARQLHFSGDSQIDRSKFCHTIKFIKCGNW